MNKFLFLRCPGGGLSLQRPSQRKQKMQSLDQGMTTVGGSQAKDRASLAGKQSVRAGKEAGNALDGDS